MLPESLKYEMRRSVLLEKFTEVQENLFNDIISEIRNDFFCYLIGHPEKHISSIILNRDFATINATGDLVVWDDTKKRNLLFEIANKRAIFLMCIVDPLIQFVLDDNTLFDIRLFLDRYFNRCKEVISNKTVKKLKHLEPYTTVKFPKNIQDASIVSITPCDRGTVYLTINYDDNAVIGPYNCSEFIAGEEVYYNYSSSLDEKKRPIICGDPVIFEMNYKINYSFPRNGELLKDSVKIKINLADSVYSLSLKDENSN